MLKTLLLVLSINIATVALCQDFRATLTGRVSDPQGAPVPGAQVFLRDVERNETQRQSVGADGNYQFALVPPGNYMLFVIDDKGTPSQAKWVHVA